jgi:hypothetical protein
MWTRISAATRISRFVAAAHARGMKVYMDIIVNHTADVIQYRGGHGRAALSLQGGLSLLAPGRGEGRADQRRFRGRPGCQRRQLGEDDRSRFAYTPYVPAGEER